MSRARFSPKAARDLDEISGYIAADNPEAAERVRRIILNTADLLAQHPELGRRIRKASARHLQIRWFVVPKFRNYLIFYQPFQETVVVVRVLHAAQDWTWFFSP
jgi:toxin ParE1/3/4